MDQLLQQQHAQEGTGNFSEQQLKDTLGGILSYIKSKLGSVDFSKIQAALPEAGNLASKAESENASRAGGDAGGVQSLMSSAMGMLGGQKQEAGSGTAAPADGSNESPIDSMTELLGYLGKMGINPQQAMAFLPIVAKFMKENAGVDVSSALGTSSTTSAAGTTGEQPATSQTTGTDTAASGSSDDMVGNLMNQASGFMSSFTKK